MQIEKQILHIGQCNLGRACSRKKVSKQIRKAPEDVTDWKCEENWNENRRSQPSINIEMQRAQNCKSSFLDSTSDFENKNDLIQYHRPRIRSHNQGLHDRRGQKKCSTSTPISMTSQESSLPTVISVTNQESPGFNKLTTNKISPLSPASSPFWACSPFCIRACT